MNALRGTLFLAAATLGLGTLAAAADGTAPAGGTIAYALTNLHWAIYQSEDGKVECPEGFNEGNREQFKKLYPESGPKRTMLDTQLQWEIESWYPTLADDGFKFQEARGPTALGLNLDGKIGPNDFTSPSGEQGVDNQLYRALGCIKNYRGPDGAIQFFDDEMVGRDQYNRILIELTGVESLVNSPNVQVTMYRGSGPAAVRCDRKESRSGRFRAHRLALGCPLHPALPRLDHRWRTEHRAHRHHLSLGALLSCDR